MKGVGSIEYAGVVTTEVIPAMRANVRMMRIRTYAVSIQLLVIRLHKPLRLLSTDLDN